MNKKTIIQMKERFVELMLDIENLSKVSLFSGLELVFKLIKNNTLEKRPNLKSKTRKH
jgi:hypothetical protein